MSDKEKRGRGRPPSKEKLQKATVRLFERQVNLNLTNQQIRAAIDAGLRILSTGDTVDVFDKAPANEQGQIEKLKKQSDD